MYFDLFYFTIFVNAARTVIPDEPVQTAAEKTTGGNLTNTTGDTGNTTANRGRRKRFDYEDVYEWEDDDDLTYEGYYEQEEEPSLYHKLAVRWRTAGPRLVWLGAFLLLLCLGCCSCCRLACRLWCRNIQESWACCGFPGIKVMCQQCYTDPMYEKVKELGEVMGIHISFNTFERIKHHYIDEDAQSEKGLFF